MQVGEEKDATVKDSSDNVIAGVKYKVSDKHRNTQNSNASYWTITPDEEYNLFVSQWLSCWYTLPNFHIERIQVGRNKINKKCFNTGEVFGETQFLPKDAFALYLVNGKPCAVGKTRADNRAKGNSPEEKRSDTIFARFESDKNSQNKKWHGYPAAPNINDHDIPDSCYLKYWAKQGYFTKAQIKRMLSKLPRKK